MPRTICRMKSRISAIVLEIGEHAALLVDLEMRHDPVEMHRLAERGEAGDLAFMAHALEAERFGGIAVELADAVLDRRHERHLLAAVDRGQLAGGEMAMAVMHGVAAAVGRDQQRVVPRAVEQRRQHMRRMMIVEMDIGIVAKAAVAAPSGNIEHVLRPRGLVAQHFVDQHHARPVAHQGPKALAQAAQAAHVAKIAGREQRAAHRDDINIPPRAAGDRQHFVDARVGLVAVALPSRQALELHRRLERIILEYGRAGIMRAAMNAENDL